MKLGFVCPATPESWATLVEPSVCPLPSTKLTTQVVMSASGSVAVAWSVRVVPSSTAERAVIVGGVVTAAAAAPTACTASTRPAPNSVSKPAAPKSTADDMSAFFTCVGVSEGAASRMSAATAATCGAASDVPKKGFENPAAPVTATPSIPVTSGLARVSAFGNNRSHGPWLL